MFLISTESLQWVCNEKRKFEVSQHTVNGVYRFQFTPSESSESWRVSEIGAARGLGHPFVPTMHHYAIGITTTILHVSFSLDTR